MAKLFSREGFNAIEIDRKFRVAQGHGPCRHCLRTFRVGEERRILFTLDPFTGVEPLPLPGPVYIHEQSCERYPSDGGFPDDLRSHVLTLEAYARGRIAQWAMRCLPQLLVAATAP